MGVNFHDLEFSDGFLGMTPKHKQQKKEEKITLYWSFDILCIKGHDQISEKNGGNIYTSHIC